MKTYVSDEYPQHTCMFTWRNKKNMNISGLNLIKSLSHEMPNFIFSEKKKKKKKKQGCHLLHLFVCVEVLQPSQPIWVMASGVSLPLFPGQALSSKWLTSTCTRDVRNELLISIWRL